MVSGSDQFPKVVDAFLGRAPGAVRDVLADYLRSATERGQLHVADPEEAAGIFLGFLHGDRYLRLLLRPNDLMTAEEIRHHVEATVRIFLNGVR
jgi:hypothetical protein